MNKWIVLCQAITFAFLIEQYQSFNEVEAQEPNSVSVGGWFGDLEQKLNVIKGVMHDVFETIKHTAKFLPKAHASPPRRVLTIDPDASNVPNANEDIDFAKTNEDSNNDINNTDAVFSQKVENTPMKKMILNLDAEEQYASGISEENSESSPNSHVKVAQHHLKKKKKVRKNTKKPKHNSKKGHELTKHYKKTHVEKQQHVGKSSEEESGMGERNKQGHKNKLSKFVKTTVYNKYNESASDENAKLGKPVDIIVHIKMNE